MTAKLKKAGLILATMFILLICSVPAMAATLKLDVSSAALYKGEKLTLRAAWDGKSVSASSARWKSSKSSVASVSKKGVVTAKAKGTATISCTYKKKTVKIKVTVKNPVYSLYVKPSANLPVTTARQGKNIVNSSSLQVGKTAKLAAYWATQKAKTTYKMVAAAKCRFTSSNKKIATVNASGVITAKKAGKATITVKYNKKTWKLTLTVKKAAAAQTTTQTPAKPSACQHVWDYANFGGEMGENLEKPVYTAFCGWPGCEKGYYTLEEYLASDCGRDPTAAEMNMILEEINATNPPGAGMKGLSEASCRKLLKAGLKCHSSAGYSTIGDASHMYEPVHGQWKKCTRCGIRVLDTCDTQYNPLHIRLKDLTREFSTFDQEYRLHAGDVIYIVNDKNPTPGRAYTLVSAKSDQFDPAFTLK